MRKVLNLTLLRTVEGYDYRTSPFFEKDYPGSQYDVVRTIFRVNEITAATVTILSNLIVILVFVRCLGLNRLPSKILVNVAVSSIVESGFHIVLHTALSELDELGKNQVACRLNGLLGSQAFVLSWNIMTTAVVERLLALQVPLYYLRANHILGPVLLLAPWVYWIMMLSLASAGIFEGEYGYNCKSHFNRLGTALLNPQGSSASIITFASVAVLLISIALMYNVDSGDVIEVNRAQFERKTTVFILKMMAFRLGFILPLWINVYGDTKLQRVERSHLMAQFNMYGGVALLMVLLTRQEFRRLMLLAFKSKKTIEQSRSVNLLIGTRKVSRKTATTESSISFATRVAADSLSSWHYNYKMSGSDKSIFSEINRKMSRMSMKLPRFGQVDRRTLVSRDRVEPIIMPEWLDKPQPRLSIWQNKPKSTGKSFMSRDREESVNVPDFLKEKL